jgi:transcription elongation factor GreB
MGRWRPPPPKSSPYVTAKGFAALQEELRALWERRHDVVRHLAAAAAEGDRSENAEYIYRKKELREIDRRIVYLQRSLPTLKVVTQAPAAPDRIYFGAIVELESDTGEVRRYHIVGPDESDAEQGCISVDSPMARALLKRAVDDEVVLRTAETTSRYLIVDIRYE